jgi:hypothetical protein
LRSAHTRRVDRIAPPTWARHFSDLNSTLKVTQIEEARVLARQFAIGFGAAIVFPLLIYYGVSTVSHAPKRSDYNPPAAAYVANMTAEERAAWQDKFKSAAAAYNDAERIFSFRLMCVSAPLGYAAILLGAWRLSSGLGAGLMFGGIFAVTDAYWWHWDFIEDWVRFVSLLIAMAVLIFVSYRLLPSRR